MSSEEYYAGSMARRKRSMLPGVPCHITQRGVNRCEVFSSDGDRETFFSLLRNNLNDTGVRLLGMCLMSNHVHLIAVPERENSLSVLMRRVAGAYALYYNARTGRTGHLWQNRFFGCLLEASHLWVALAYVDLNPVRAGMVRQAADYRWSSALAHVTGTDATGLLDIDWWQREAPPEWNLLLGQEDAQSVERLRACTYAGKPFGGKEFVREVGERFGRRWVRGRPSKKKPPHGASDHEEQFTLF